MPDELIRPFTHFELARLPEYAAAAQALDTLAHALDHADGPLPITRSQFILIAAEIATALPYSDDCECDTAPTVAPWAVTIDDGWLTGSYRCPACGRGWTCGYSTSIVDMVEQPARQLPHNASPHATRSAEFRETGHENTGEG